MYANLKQLWSKYINEISSLTLSIFDIKGGKINQRSDLMKKTMELIAGRSGVKTPGRGKFSLRTIAVDARISYPLNLQEKTASSSNAPLLLNLKKNFGIIDSFLLSLSNNHTRVDRAIWVVSSHVRPEY